MPAHDEDSTCQGRYKCERDGCLYCCYCNLKLQEPTMPTENTTAPTIIKPTVGRIVYYNVVSYPKPIPAIITGVRDDQNIAVTVFPDSGTPYPAGVVRLIQSGESPVPFNPYCTWMPYQVGQAEKYGTAEAEVQRLKTELDSLKQSKQTAPSETELQRIKREHDEYLARVAQVQKEASS